MAGELSGMVPKVMVKAFIIVLTFTVCMCVTVYKGYFKKIGVETGSVHYAEKVHPAVEKYLPSDIKMPLNSLVNIGYVFVGAAWCAYTSVMLMRNRISMKDARMFYVFNIASCCYGPIQMLRIITQFHGFAVLDQWYTLPFFMWIFIWGVNHKCGWSTLRNLLLTVASITSYSSVFYHVLGFEMCLGVHIALALTGAVLAWSANNQAHCGKYFVLALLSCLGFVVLKLLDLTLAEVAPIFKYVSGHFLSKICDIFQIHYCNHYFQEIALSAMADSKKKKE